MSSGDARKDSQIHLFLIKRSGKQMSVVVVVGLGGCVELSVECGSTWEDILSGMPYQPPTSLLLLTIALSLNFCLPKLT